MVCDAAISRMNGAKSKGAKTERGKAIASRNATKHGLLAAQPPLLASEDLETFQGVIQSLVNQYQPDGVLEWHCVQQIAMCIQRQHRLWQAEAAAGNEAVLPQPPVATTAEKYPSYLEPENLLEVKSEFHPDHLTREKQVLRRFIEQIPSTQFPAKYRSKYFEVEWNEWLSSFTYGIDRALEDYPGKTLAGFPDVTLARFDKEGWVNKYIKWLKSLREKNHPFAILTDFQVELKDSWEMPRTKWEVNYRRNRVQSLLSCCDDRIAEIEAIERERELEAERIAQQQAERDRLTRSPIPQSVALLARYESHINNQLMQALERLNTLQGHRLTSS